MTSDVDCVLLFLLRVAVVAHALVSVANDYKREYPALVTNMSLSGERFGRESRRIGE